MRMMMSSCMHRDVNYIGDLDCSRFLRTTQGTGCCTRLCPQKCTPVTSSSRKLGLPVLGSSDTLLQGLLWHTSKASDTYGELLQITAHGMVCFHKLQQSLRCGCPCGLMGGLDAVSWTPRVRERNTFADDTPDPASHPSHSRSTVIKAHWSMVPMPWAQAPAAEFHNKPAAFKCSTLTKHPMRWL